MATAKYPNDRQLKLRTAPGRVSVAPNLFLVIGQGGARSWSLIYTSRVTGQRREYGLGSAHDVTLAEARAMAEELRPKIKRGYDPIEEKKNDRRQAQADATTIGMYLDEWIVSRGQQKKWRAGTERNIRGALKNLPESFMGLKIAEVTSENVIAELEPIWSGAPNVGALVQNILERALDAATVKKLRQGDNPARWRNFLDQVFTRPSTGSHHKAIPFKDIPDWYAQNDFDPLKLLVLTATRSSEVRLARWSEIDLDAKVWTIPAERMKSKRQYRVPLTDAAIVILDRIERTQSPFVFRGGKLAQATMVLKIGRPGYTAHGFRSAFRDWAFEETDHSREIIEMSLAHAVGDATERAYRRGDAIEKRRALLKDWADYVTSKSPR